MSSTFSSLGRAVLAALVVIGLPQVARADFIDLISQSYTIHERAVGIANFVEFNEISTTPISHGEGGVFNPGTQNIGGYSMSASANGGVTPLSAFVQVQSDSFDLALASVERAESTAAISFMPLVSGLVVQITNPYGPPPPFPFFPPFGSASLFDDTAGLTVLAFPPYTAAAFFVSLNLDHQYTISTSSGTGPQRGVGLSLAPASVPESETTLTFLVVGLGALLLVARAQTTFRPAN
jgi:hypothetical protein